MGYGKPSENPYVVQSIQLSLTSCMLNDSNVRLFVNIVTPPSFPSRGNFPVKVYIHGGYVYPSPSSATLLSARPGSSNSAPPMALAPPRNTSPPSAQKCG